MNSKVFAGIVIVGVAGLAATLTFIEADKSKLRRQIAALQVNETKLARAEAELRRSESLVTQLKTEGAAGTRAIHASLVQVRADLAALEKKAEQGLTKKSAESAATVQALRDNRDPAQGMTKLEFIDDVGRATPAAAIQTLIWAVLKGHEAEMSAGVAVDGPAREMAQALLNALPETSREKYHTPEQLAALFFASSVLESTAFQFVGSSTSEADHASVTVRIQANGRERETQIPMVRGADGWRMVVAEKQIEGIRGRLTGESARR